MGVNVVHLIGNLGHDPELRKTRSGEPVVNLRLAVNERRKGPDGEWGEVVEWFNVTAWSRTAENVAKFLRKGSQIYVEGSLRTRDWTDKEGKDRRSTEISAKTVKFLGSKVSQNSTDGYSPAPSTSTRVETSDIPF
tara:strand:- start:2581 stop:2988 length:408 start_codon:yes stop_codon:yes gene_type:complete